ncbi:Guanine nucleotide-binding protein subunit alpha-13 [Armadillidium vulgare]|nr:Guanine nucleotide-binding protein subunit alpha-13 [Armadillidium vulgare]
MRIIHGFRFDQEELNEYKLTIYRNIVLGMKVLLDARNKLFIPWGDEQHDSCGNHVMKFSISMPLETEDFLEYSPSVKELWKDPGIKEAYRRRSEFQLVSILYLSQMIHNNMHISSLQIHNNMNISSLHDVPNVMDYVPTDRDILHARKATKTITEFTIPINNVPFLFVDVGGQRTQRQKWFQCFESVTSIIFLASSSEFDQKLLEDRTTNRLEESLTIFSTIANNRSFRDVSIILFLNKTDLLIQKVRARQSNIAHYFTDFVGNPHDERDVQQFILQKFVEQRRQETSARRPLFHHFTTAVDTENIKVVFNSVKDTILQKNLEVLMLQ